MGNRIKYILFIIAIGSLTTCKVPYTPEPITAVSNYLVVEGLINITDSTYINLSRTVSISSASAVKPELKATINIVSNQGNSYPLTELGKGVYAAAPLNLSAANQYQLQIKTANGEQYVSAFVPALVSPPVDSISWATRNNALEIYANTHDPGNTIYYYRWDFTEAWQFHASFNSQAISNGHTISNRLPSQQIDNCYTGDASTNVSLATSTGLGRDVISQALVNTIPADAERISIKYTIGLKQYALTKDAYDYWNLLKTNTQQLGSIFDAQPSASIGNLHCLTNPAEVVIGYISAGTITTSRIFITRAQLPQNWVTTPFYPNCDYIYVVCCNPEPQDIYPSEDEVLNYLSPTFDGVLFIPLSGVGVGDPPPGYIAALPMCIDCTIRGSVTPPAYWQ